MNNDLTLLLKDEVKITPEDFNERLYLIEEFKKMPEDFFSKLRHFQPQIGCLNACAFCSKQANSTTQFWGIKRLRNIIAALKYSSPQKNEDMSKITYDRKEHRNSVVFPYLDNDIGNYPYLDEFIKLCYTELGVTTRVSTVGYSRFNDELNAMHKRINELDTEGLGGVRISFSPYEKGWECNSSELSKFDYILDMANILNIYKPYYLDAGPGERRMCVELRYRPLVKTSEVITTEVLKHVVIYTENYMWISKHTNPEFYEAHIKDPYDHFISLTSEPVIFHEIDLFKSIESEEEVKRIAHKFITKPVEASKNAEVYLMRNFEGIYFAINPCMTVDGNYGINIYPKTEDRITSGYLITERFLLNEIIKYKKTRNLSILDKFNDANWDDVYEILDMMKKSAKMYHKSGKTEKHDYIMNEILPMINGYINALQTAEYKASEFFNPDFTIDTGIICNLGRAVKEFKGLTNKENEPLTPVHERNYGMYNSKMKQEGVSWRLSCDYNNSIVIEKLNMYDTASVRGQVGYRFSIPLNESIEDEIFTTQDLKSKYLIPGQRRLL